MNPARTTGMNLPARNPRAPQLSFLKHPGLCCSIGTPGIWEKQKYFRGKMFLFNWEVTLIFLELSYLSFLCSFWSFPLLSLQGQIRRMVEGWWVCALSGTPRAAPPCWTRWWRADCPCASAGRGTERGRISTRAGCGPATLTCEPA